MQGCVGALQRLPRGRDEGGVERSQAQKLSQRSLGVGVQVGPAYGRSPAQKRGQKGPEYFCLGAESGMVLLIFGKQLVKLAPVNRFKGTLARHSPLQAE